MKWVGGYPYQGYTEPEPFEYPCNEEEEIYKPNNITMNKINREIFYSSIRNSIGKLTQQQIIGLGFLLTKLEQSQRIDSVAKGAYVLATVKWETANTYEPITEYGSQAYLRSKSYYPYIGKGYVMLTWVSNYIKFGEALGIDLEGNPDLANEPETAWKILEMGMTDNFGIQDPDFTKYTLEDFIHGDTVDFYNARKIVNPKDWDSYKPIQANAIKFYKALQDAEILQAKAVGGTVNESPGSEKGDKIG